MPTYEYACRKCNEHLEVVQSFKDDPLTDCPACGAQDELRKVFSAAGIIFKGSGWHVKDYSSAKSSSAKTDSKTDSSASSSSSDASTSSSTDSSTSSGASEAKSA